jgi:hypothetical protein
MISISKKPNGPKTQGIYRRVKNRVRVRNRVKDRVKNMVMG